LKKPLGQLPETYRRRSAGFFFGCACAAARQVMTNGLCWRLPVGNPEAASLGDTISWVVPPEAFSSSSSRKTSGSVLPFSPTLEAGVALLLIVLSLSRVVGGCTSAADLKFLHHCRKFVQELQIEKRH
jgi:hypothetical protein